MGVSRPGQDTGCREPFPRSLVLSSSWPFIQSVRLSVGQLRGSLCVPFLNEYLLSVVCWELGCCVVPAVQPWFLGGPTVCQAVGTHCVSGPGLLCAYAFCEHLLCAWPCVCVSIYCVPAPGLMCEYLLCQEMDCCVVIDSVSPNCTQGWLLCEHLPCVRIWAAVLIHDVC